MAIFKIYRPGNYESEGIFIGVKLGNVSSGQYAGYDLQVLDLFEIPDARREIIHAWTGYFYPEYYFDRMAMPGNLFMYKYAYRDNKGKSQAQTMYFFLEDGDSHPRYRYIDFGATHGGKNASKVSVLAKIEQHEVPEEIWGHNLEVRGLQRSRIVSHTEHHEVDGELLQDVYTEEQVLPDFKSEYFGLDMIHDYVLEMEENEIEEPSRFPFKAGAVMWYYSVESFAQARSQIAKPYGFTHVEEWMLYQAVTGASR